MANTSLSLRTRSAVPAVLAAACALALVPATAGAAPIESGTAAHSDLSPPLRTLEPSPSQASGAHPARRFGNTLDEFRLAPHDRGRQAVDAPAAAPVPGSQWEGVNNVNGVIPPDTNGDVGPRDYVQWVNLSLQIWSKSGASRYGPVPGNTLFQGFGGVCETTNRGDPLVTYDRAADRWVLMQFAFAVKGGKDAPPYRICVAVSQTGDPTGAYHRYEFGVTNATNYFPDYPKLGVWNDAYYLTTNNFNGNTFAGAGIYALDRTKMLAGDATAGFVGQQLPAVYGGLLPAHRDGATPPPPGAPGYFAAIDTTGAGTGSTLQVWRMQPNFATPAATTVSGPANIAVNPYRFSFGCTADPDCVPQAGTMRTLDSLPDRLMHRLVYRNFGGHESLLLTHTVNVASGSASQAGERWYELRDVGTAPTVYQQGTYAPADGVSRWMGSAAMDGYGDIALGYSASSSSMSPAIRYTGRLAGDPLGSMTLGEQTLLAGGGSQTGYPRWGDYSSMSIDPVDDATFWYTQEYYSSTSSAGWRTRIGSFKLVTTPDVALTAPADGAVSTGTPAFSGTSAGGTGDVTVEIYSGGSTSGALAQTLNATPSGGGAWSASASPPLAEGTYTAQARQSGASGHVGFSQVSTFRVDSTPPAVTISSPASGTLTSDSTPTFSGTGGTAPGDLSAIAVDVHSGGAAGPIAATLNTTRAAGGGWSVTPSTALADGAYTAIARESDSAGNAGASVPASFSVDSTPPIVSLTGPGAATNDTTPGFGGAATAGDLAAVSVKLYSGTSATGTALQTLNTTQTAGAWGPVSATVLAQGTYTARAQQSDSAGNTGFSSPLTFTVDTNEAPVASFGFAPASPLVGALVAFDGSASADPDGSIASWAWSFGDGGAGTGATTSHAYLAAGPYTAQLTVTDSAGGSASTARELTVASPPVVPAGGSAAAPPEPVSPAIVPPQLSVRLARQRLGGLLRRGLSFVVSSNVPGVARQDLTVSRRTARRLGLGRRTTIASARRGIRADTPLKVALRLRRGVRAHLTGVRRLRATLRVTLGSTKVVQPVKLRR